MSILRDGPAISLLPKLLKPILGPLITWKGQKDCEACIRILIPLIEERLKQLEQRRIGSSDGLRPSVRASTSLFTLSMLRLLLLTMAVERHPAVGYRRELLYWKPRADNISANSTSSCNAQF